MARRRVVVVQGGPSSEAEVSRVSAKAVASALAEVGHVAIRMELSPFLAESVRSGGFDVVFPATHGAVGEDGCLQGLLEVIDIPYVGTGVLGCALAMDKRVARRMFEGAGLPVTKGVAVRRRDGGDALAAAASVRREIGERLVVKPANGGSAIGVTRLDEGKSLEDVAAALEVAWRLDPVAIVEHFVRGREVTCGVLEAHVPPRRATDGPPAPRALPPTEIVVAGDEFYTFDSRYTRGRSVHHCPAPLPPAVLARVREVAVLAHEALGCRDLSRADFVVGDDDAPDAVFLLEVNTLPGFTETSLYPEAARVDGISFPALCDALIEAAIVRGATPRNAPRPFPAM